MTEAEFLELGHILSDTARRLALRFYRTPFAVETKADLSPVTLADKGIEAALRDLIRAHAPGVSIIGEEMEAEGAGDQAIVIDPIDGTKAFITGFPLFGTLIAYADKGRPVAGFIETPAMNERFVGGSGGAWLNGAPIRVSRCQRLSEAKFYTATPDHLKGRDLEVWTAVSAASGLRRIGGDCYMYGLLAAGFCDLVVEAGLQTYDFMALVPVVQGAGGVMTDWEGAPLNLYSDGRVIAAATPQLHAEVLKLIRSV